MSVELSVDEIRQMPEYELGMRLAASTASSMMGDKNVDNRLKHLRRAEQSRALGGQWVALALVAQEINGHAFGGRGLADDDRAIRALAMLKEYLQADVPSFLGGGRP